VVVTALGQAIQRAEEILSMVSDSDWTPQDAALDHLIRAARKVEATLEWGVALRGGDTFVDPRPVLDEATARAHVANPLSGSWYVAICRYPKSDWIAQ
jgi:hypothetical protein